MRLRASLFSKVVGVIGRALMTGIFEKVVLSSFTSFDIFFKVKGQQRSKAVILGCEDLLLEDLVHDVLESW